MSKPFISQLEYAPRRQERIDHGVLLRWTKGFGAPNVEGKDVVALLNISLAKFVRTSSKVNKTGTDHHFFAE